MILYRLHPDRRDYLWISCYFAAMTGWTIAQDHASIRPVPIQLFDYIHLGLTNLAQFFMLQFLFPFLRLPMPGLLRGYQISLLPARCSPEELALRGA